MLMCAYYNSLDFPTERKTVGHTNRLPELVQFQRTLWTIWIKWFDPLDSFEPFELFKLFDPFKPLNQLIH